MKTFRAIVLRTGLAGGIAFVIATYANAGTVNSLAVTCPLIAGAVALWLATRLPAEHRLLNGLRATLVTGLIAGATAFVGISIVASLRVHFMHLPWDETGQTGLITAASLFAFAMIGVVDLLCALVGGLLVLPVRYFQLRRALG
jgi:hypothetical protein